MGMRLFKRLRGKLLTGVRADLAEAHAEIERLQDEVADLRAALTPFADVGKTLCGCPKCRARTLQFVAPKGRAVVLQHDFCIAEEAMKTAGQRRDAGLPV